MVNLAANAQKKPSSEQELGNGWAAVMSPGGLFLSFSGSSRVGLDFLQNKTGRAGPWIV
jgi:hypothetical protein